MSSRDAGDPPDPAFLVRLAGPVRDLDVCDAGVGQGGSFRSEFDVLVTADILEHAPNPGDTLASAHEAVRRDGRFVVRVSYREDLQQPRRLPHPVAHLPAFTGRVLRRALEQAGFRVERMFDGFVRDRLRPALRPHERVHRRVREFLDGRYRTPAELNAMNVHLDRLMLRPKTLTAAGRRECP